MSSAATIEKDVQRLPEEQGKKLFGTAATIAALGLAGSAAAFFVDKQRFAHSWLVGFYFLTTIGLGALFFVLIQHLTRAGWSVAPRRHMEWVSGVLPFCALLFVPVAALAHDLYHHWMSAEAMKDPILKGKSGYLNVPFFYGRSVLYFVIWAGIAFWFAKQSADQDAAKKGDTRAFTGRMQGAAAPAILLFALSLTFAAFDWIMSLDPHWFSTIFGVYIFAGSVTSSLAVLAIININLQKQGLLKRVSTIEHRHDIGKLLFGFIVFWAYIGFSQFFLIWYANIPEETIFFKRRLVGEWQYVSYGLLLGHFVLPFLMLLSRHTKRSVTVLRAAAVIMLVMHYIDIYWLVMPSLDVNGAHFTWVDLVCLLGPVGVGMVVVAKRMQSSNLYPINDPRLPEAVKLQNL